MKTIAPIAVVILLIACTSSPSPQEEEEPSMQVFGTLPTGEEVPIYTLRNANGVEARITSYGATLVSLRVPDRDGNLADVIFGFDSLEGYLGDPPYFGAIVGRYGNRIALGKFTLDGQEYTLATNNGANSLHGGNRGFDKVLWNGEMEGDRLILTYTSPDGEEGYPGTLTATVTYSLTEDNALQIDYEATTDKPTVVNLTNHAYFNLRDAGASPILDHQMMINADAFTPVDEGLIPTGEIRPVDGTPFDFREPTAIGARIDADNEQIRFGGGYDHNFVLNRTSEGLALAARVYNSTTGREMEVLTTEPGVQFYTGNFLDGTITGKGGVTYQRRSGFCLETQHFPDSPNKPEFPTTVLRPGETYRTTTLYRFSAR